jgi:hypothetical protein
MEMSVQIKHARVFISPAVNEATLFKEWRYVNKINKTFINLT